MICWLTKSFMRPYLHVKKSESLWMNRFRNMICPKGFAGVGLILPGAAVLMLKAVQRILDLAFVPCNVRQDHRESSGVGMTGRNSEKV